MTNSVCLGVELGKGERAVTGHKRLGIGRGSGLVLQETVGRALGDLYGSVVERAQALGGLRRQQAHVA